ncbi:MAG: N-acetylmuramoyl-L-alanine amidase [Bacteroidales bacterium]|nr:N-acetylmuramoyl-L-alanine amidase [Bacteroidales bacterium]
MWIIKRYFTYFKIFILIVFFVSVYGVSLNAQYKINTVVIDAGHGGKDPGAIGKKAYEKDITLKIALKLGNYIKKNLKGVKVIYTRKTDVFVELFKRAEIANKNNAQVFISIHVNSNEKSSYTGTSTYVMGVDKSDENLEVAQLENSVILKEKSYKKNYKGFDPNSPESYITLSLLQNAHLEQSLQLAKIVQDQFRTRAGRKDRGVRQAGLVVLWNATMPAILVETGFISNPTEEKYLMTDYGQSIIASAIFRAFREYKNQIEKNSKYVPVSSQKTNTNKQNTSINKASYTKTETGIIFRVQIRSSANRIPSGSSEFKGLKNVKEINYKGIYKYYYGATDSFSEILKIQEVVRKKIPDAFVVSFKNGKRIPLDQALKEIGRR